MEEKELFSEMKKQIISDLRSKNLSYEELEKLLDAAWKNILEKSKEEKFKELHKKLIEEGPIIKAEILADYVKEGTYNLKK